MSTPVVEAIFFHLLSDSCSGVVVRSSEVQAVASEEAEVQPEVGTEAGQEVHSVQDFLDLRGYHSAPTSSLHAAAVASGSSGGTDRDSMGLEGQVDQGIQVLH